METRNFIVAFLVFSSFCLGERGETKKIPGVLPVLPSFGYRILKLK